MLIIEIGKSGAGKTAVCDKLCEHGWQKIVTTTTRKRRKDEKDGVDYRFTNNESFVEGLANGEFLEHKEYILADDTRVYYGSPLQEIKNVKAEDNKVIILTPDGYRDFKKQCPSVQHICIYVYANWKTLETRLKWRNSEKKDEIKRRMMADEADFKDADKLADKIVYNNFDSDLDKVTNKILELVKRRNAGVDDNYKKGRSEAKV